MSAASSIYLGTKPASFVRHLMTRNRKAAGRRKLLIVGLTLTSMVDMFSLLVIFLLQSFSSAPELVAITKGITLPSASTGRDIKEAPILSLSSEGVFLDQKKIGTVDELLQDPTALMEKLSGIRTFWLKTHPNQNFPGEINLQAHKDISSVKVSQVMSMLPSQNFGAIQLAVVAGGNTERAP